MVLYFDIVPDAVGEHDDWHTHEHFPERLSIPGFLRASRWIAVSDSPRYLVLYEVESVDVLSSAPYLERLNHPTPWTSKMMPSYRGMTRGFCRLRAITGLGLGNALLSIRYSPIPGRQGELREWLAAHVLPAMVSGRGLASAHLLEPAAKAPMTKEQAIRGKDAETPWVLLLTGYGEDAVARVADEELAVARFAEHGGSAESVRGRYRLDLVATAAATAREGAGRLP